MMLFTLICLGQPNDVQIIRKMHSSAALYAKLSGEKPVAFQWLKETNEALRAFGKLPEYRKRKCVREFLDGCKDYWGRRGDPPIGFMTMWEYNSWDYSTLDLVELSLGNNYQLFGFLGALEKVRRPGGGIFFKFSSAGLASQPSMQSAEVNRFAHPCISKDYYDYALAKLESGYYTRTLETGRGRDADG